MSSKRNVDSARAHAAKARGSITEHLKYGVTDRTANELAGRRIPPSPPLPSVLCSEKQKNAKRTQSQYRTPATKSGSAFVSGAPGQPCYKKSLEWSPHRKCSALLRGHRCR